MSDASATSMLLNMEHLEQLIHAAQRGDADSYRVLLEESARMARAYVARRISKPEDVEDVVQEILIAIHKARHTYQSSRPYKPWLYALAGYKLNDYLRNHYRKAAREELTDTLPDTAADENVTFADRTHEQLEEALSGLNERQKTILYKTKVEGHTHKEVADTLGMSETAVKVAAHRALKKLQRKFTEND